MTDPAAGTRCRIPHLHSTQISPPGQQTSTWPPGPALEDGVGSVRIPKQLQTSTRGRIPEPDGIVPPTAGQQSPVRTPRDPMHDPTMSTQHFGRHPADCVPHGHQRMRSPTDQLSATRTPVDVIEGDRITPYDAHTLSTFHVPSPYGAIFTATQQTAAIGGEGDRVHVGGMPMQCRLIAFSFDVPEPDRLVKASASHRAPIGTPCHAEHPVRMSRKRLEQSSARHVPEPDGPVPACASKPG